MLDYSRSSFPGIGQVYRLLWNPIIQQKSHLESTKSSNSDSYQDRPKCLELQFIFLFVQTLAPQPALKFSGEASALRSPVA